MAAGVPDGRLPLPDRVRAASAGDELVNHPDVDGITFTGSYEVGMEIYKRFAKDVPQARDLRDGRQEPDDRHGQGRPGQGRPTGCCVRRSGSAGRSARRNSRVYVHRGRVRRVRVRTLKEKTEKRQDRRPARARRLPGPGDRRRRGGHVRGGVQRGEARTARRHGRRAARPRVSFAQGMLRASPPIAEVPLDSWIWKKELFVPFVAVAPYDELDEAIRPGQRHRVRPDGRLLQRGSAPRSTPGSSRDRGRRRVREPAGRGDDRRVAGRAAVRRLEGFGHHRQGRRRPYYVTQYLREQSRTVIEE